MSFLFSTRKGLKLKSKTFKMTHYQHRKIELFRLSEVPKNRCVQYFGTRQHFTAQLNTCK